MISSQENRAIDLDKWLKSLCYRGRVKDAVGLLWRCGMKLYPVNYSLLLQESIFQKQYECGKILHAHLIVFGQSCSIFLQNKLLILYSKLGDLRTALIFFHGLKETHLVSWNAIISGYVQNGRQDLSLQLYYEMRDTGLNPDQYTFASIFKACAMSAELERGKQAHSLMIKLHLKENVIVSSALVDMYFKCCDINSGCKVFDRTVNRNVFTWTCLISGFALHGRVVEVLEYFRSMIGEGFRPNYVTFLAVISACNYAGLVKEGWNHFLSMERDFGIKPRKQHYAVMVDLLGRVGRLQEAFMFAQSSPYKEHAVVWGSLLNACRIYGDRELLKLVTKQYFDLDSKNAGKHVVLSNALANSEDWINVAEVRKWMKVCGIIKEPGYSRITVNGTEHVFLSGDKLSEKYKNVCTVVDEISCFVEDSICITLNSLG